MSATFRHRRPDAPWLARLPTSPRSIPASLRRTAAACRLNGGLSDDGSVAPIIGGLPAVEGSAWDIGAPLEDRGAGLEDEQGSPPDGASDEDTRLNLQRGRCRGCTFDAFPASAERIRLSEKDGKHAPSGREAGRPCWRGPVGFIMRPVDAQPGAVAT
jgi:hypothetical protein